MATVLAIFWGVCLSVDFLIVLFIQLFESCLYLRRKTALNPTLEELLAKLSLLQLSEAEFKACRRAVKRMTPAQWKQVYFWADCNNGLSTGAGGTAALLPTFRHARAKYHVLRLCRCFKEAKTAMWKLHMASYDLLDLGLEPHSPIVLRCLFVFDVIALVALVILLIHVLVLAHNSSVIFLTVFWMVCGNVLLYSIIGRLGLRLSHCFTCMACYLQVLLRWAWLSVQERTSAAAPLACQDDTTTDNSLDGGIELRTIAVVPVLVHC